MAMDESHWIERAQSAEAKLGTALAAIQPLREKFRAFKDAFGIKERSDGSFDIDFDKFAAELGVEAALVLRKAIDEKYKISGDAGAKPRIRVTA